MYELVQVGNNSYYMDCPAKVGFWVPDGSQAYLIDSGSDKDSAKKVRKILEAQNWTLKAIFNTHSHADHTGGNAYLQGLTGCKIYAPEAERAVAENPFLEPVMLYGGFPFKDLQNKFLMAEKSEVSLLTSDILPPGLDCIKLLGHSYYMVGFRTSDDVVFLADSLSSRETLEKYKIGFLYDVKAYLETLEQIMGLQAKCFVPSHAQCCDDISDLAKYNIEKTLETSALIEGLLTEPKTVENIIADVFSAYSLNMNLQQRVLIGSTVNSYLSYLKSCGRVDFRFENNRMVWQKAVC